MKLFLSAMPCLPAAMTTWPKDQESKQLVSADQSKLKHSLLSSSNVDKLQHRDTLLVFTYAPAGLGHMRVMNALIDGLPQNIEYAILGTNDTRIRYWHRIISLSPNIREI